MATRTELIADLLMGAAHADPLQNDDPYTIVCSALKQVMGAGYLLTEMGARLKAFDIATFDLHATLDGLGLQDPVEKRQLLELVAAVHVADEIVAEEEDEFLREVAEAMELPEESYADLTLDIVERHSLYEARDSLLGPPPLPKS